MDSTYFDLLTRQVAATRSRRSLGGALVGTLAALLSTALPDDVQAHNARKRCREIKDKKKRAKCLKRARRHNATHRPPATKPDCTSPADCPAPSQPCAQSACVNGKCTVAPVPAGSRTCRTAIGICDLPEVCDGIFLDCPPDQVQPATFMCRPQGAGGAHLTCDMPEYCTGVGVACPADQFRPVGTSCGTPTNPCQQQTCNGAGQCVQSGRPDGITCNGGGVCCNGDCCNETCENGRCCRSAGSICTTPGQCCSNTCTVVDPGNSLIKECGEQTVVPNDYDGHLPPTPP